MPAFTSFKQASEFFYDLAEKVEQAKEEMLDVGAKIVEEEMKSSLGTYQQAAGPYNEWAQLSERTQKARLAAGYTPNDPLLRSGAMRDDIQTVRGEDIRTVGTNMPFSSAIENGDGLMPARPFVGRAGWVKQQEILEAQAEILLNTLEGY